MTIGRVAGMKTCDDCGREYPGPAYYTFHPSQCVVINVIPFAKGMEYPYLPPVRHSSCTGNLCPDCAGPDLEPDRPDDPRRPT